MPGKPYRRLDPPDGGDEPRRPLIGISLLPSAATLGNLLCGFMAIFFCLLSIREMYVRYITDLGKTHPEVKIDERYTRPRPVRNPHLEEFFPTYVAMGAYLIVAAMIFDALDGRLARIARRTTEFGAQLDSIADIMSFGAAPAMLFLTLLIELAVPAGGDPLVSKIQWRISLLCALVYLSCAAIRLARYNAENTQDESGQKRFSGLPSPGAAAALTALIILHEDLTHPDFMAWGIHWASVVRWAAAPAAFGLGILMVTRLNYTHMVNVYVRREYPPIYLIWLLVAAGIAWASPQVLLVVLAYAYVFSGLIHSLKQKRQALPEKEETEEPEPYSDAN